MNNISNQSIPTGVRFIRGIYWIATFFAIICIPLRVVRHDLVTKVSMTEILLTLTVNITILAGFYKRKYWLVLLILIDSSWKFIWQFLNVVGGDADLLVQKFGHLMFALLFSYQIYIFTKRETQAHFNWKGKTLT